MPTTNLGLATINLGDAVSPDPINSNMEIIDNLGVDYVVARGDSGAWRYRRWKSGLYECWCYGISQSAAPGENNLVQMHVNYPITFVTYPVVNINVRVAQSPGSFVGYVERSQTYAEWYVGGVYATAEIDFYIYACGPTS